MCFAASPQVLNEVDVINIFQQSQAEFNVYIRKLKTATSISQAMDCEEFNRALLPLLHFFAIYSPMLITGLRIRSGTSLTIQPEHRPRHDP